jgi:hypothetical protein
MQQQEEKKHNDDFQTEISILYLALVLETRDREREKSKFLRCSFRFLHYGITFDWIQMRKWNVYMLHRNNVVLVISLERERNFGLETCNFVHFRQPHNQTQFTL